VVGKIQGKHGKLFFPGGLHRKEKPGVVGEAMQGDEQPGAAAEA
jgi:hypothetical protein